MNIVTFPTAMTIFELVVGDSEGATTKAPAVGDDDAVIPDNHVAINKRTRKIMLT